MLSVLCCLLISIIFVIFHFGVCSSLNCSYPLPWSQYDALYDFYLSSSGSKWCPASGARWNFPSNWSQADVSSPCTSNWTGITCSCSISDEYTVTSLILQNSCCVGQLTESISKLIDLHHLDVSANYFSHYIPSELWSLKNLEYLYLGSNRFSGRLSNDMYSCVNLTVLSLSSNYFSGTLSRDISKLSSLTSLMLLSNLFTGTIPNEIGTLPNCSTLSLGNFAMNGSIPSALGNLSLLTELYIIGSFVGEIPFSFSNFVDMKILFLDLVAIEGNCMSFLGSLNKLINLYINVPPSCWTYMPNLTYFPAIQSIVIYAPSMYGRFPVQIGTLSFLSSLDIQSNSITGPIPSDIGLCSNLNTLSLNAPALTGPFPESILKLRNLFAMYIVGNLTGTLPNGIYDFPMLYYLFLDGIYMSGSIPSQLFSLPRLGFLVISSIGIGGELPSNIGNSSSIEVLSLFCNSLTSSIPSSISQMTRLSTLNIFSLFMSGQLPEGISNLANLGYISIYMGFASSSIPSSFYAQFSRLATIVLSGGFTGSFPEHLSLSQLNLNLSDNFLTSSFPPKIFNSSTIQNLVLSSNLFSQSLPSYFFLPKLYLCSLDDNLLSGTISSTLLSSLSSLAELMLNNNKFSGSLPPSGLDLPKLQLIQLQNNYFTGHLEWNSLSSFYSMLQHIDISNNLFTGSIPSDVFLLPHLSVFSSGNNCFRGSLPSSLCKLNEILDLVMDGLSSNPNCPKNKNLNDKKPFFVRGFLQSNYMTGTVPVCLWNLTSLSTLHLAGNGFVGSIPVDNFPNSLLDVSLSNNLFSGTIPIPVQKHGFKQLFLANNRFSGTLVTDFVVNYMTTAVTLSVNRLSGDIPSSFASDNVASVSQFNVLASNIFKCSSSQLPSNDPDSKSYVCGSTELADAEYFWLAMLSFVIVVSCSILLWWYLQKGRHSHSCFYQRFLSSIDSFIMNLVTKIQLWEKKCEDIVMSPYLMETHRFLSTLEHFRVICLLGLVLIVVFGLLVYLVLKIHFSSSYSTVTFQYGWVYSSAFLQGVLPTCLTAIFVVLILMLFTYSILLHNHKCKNITIPKTLNQDSDHNDTSQSLSSLSSWAETQDVEDANAVSSNTPMWKIWILCFILQLINFAVTLVVNGSYVNAVLNNSLSTVFVLPLQLCLASFKVFWNITFIGSSLTRVGLSVPSQMAHRLLMSLVNFIVSPCLASLYSIQSCFYFIFHEATPIQSSFDAAVCVIYSAGTCSSVNTFSYATSFIPPFLYSYQCGSNIIVTYIPILIYSYAISGVIGPSIAYGCSLMDYSWMKITDRFFQVNGKSKMVLFLQHIAILLTFGVSCPLLAIVICGSIVLESLVWKHLVAKMLLEYSTSKNDSVVELTQGSSGSKSSDHVENPIRDPIQSAKSMISSSDVNDFTSVSSGVDLNHFDETFKDAWLGSRSSLILVVIIVAFFWSLMFFDMIGSSIDFHDGLLVLLLFAFGTPLIIYLEVRVIRFFQQK